MVERFGATAFPNLDAFDLSRISHILYVRDLYEQAGRKGQEKVLSPSDWEYIKRLDDLAAAQEAYD